MSESNNNTPMRITQLDEATEYPEGAFYPIAKAGWGTKKIPANLATPEDNYIKDSIGFNGLKFSVVSGGTHSSTLDEIAYEIKNGEQFICYAVANTGQAVSGMLVAFDSSDVKLFDVGGITLGTPRLFTASADIAKFGIYLNAVSADTIIDFKIIKRNSEYGEYITDFNIQLCDILENARTSATDVTELDTVNNILTLPPMKLYDNKRKVKYEISNTQSIDYSSLGNIRPILVYYDVSNSTFGIYNLNNGIPTNNNYLWVALINQNNICINTPIYINGNLCGKNIQIPSNVTLGNTPPYIEIDSKNKTITFPIGTIIWNAYERNKRYELTANNNSVSYATLGGSSFNVAYNVANNTLIVGEFYYMPNSGEKTIFLGSVKQYNRKVTASFSCEYRVDGTPASDNLEGYWKENVNSVIDKIALLQNFENGVNLAFISDMHWETNWKESPQIMKYLCENSRIETVINGGDLASGDNADGENQRKWLYQCTGAFSGNFDYYSIIGNHDNNSVGSANVISQQELKNLILPNPSKVSYGPGNYYSFEKENTLFICLDTGTQGSADSAQIAWAENEIETTTAEYIIIFMHIIFLSNSDQNPCTFFTDLITMINALDNDKKAKIQAIFGGHTHHDNNYTFSNIPVVVIDTDSRFADDGINRTQYTLKSQCFDVITINYDDKIIDCTRVGEIGQDRHISY